MLAIAAFAVTLDRVPIAWGDDVTYASIARAVQQGSGRAPTILGDSSTAVDHVSFYGPVFFRLTAIAFDAFGFSIRSARLVALLGGVIAACAGAWLVAALGGDRARRIWAFTLILLTPEIGTASTNGRMDSLAIGLGLGALAAFVRGLAVGRHPAWDGVLAGGLLSAAILTGPRMWPFAVAWLMAALIVPPVWRRRPARVQSAWTAAVFVTVCVVWATAAYGSPWRWLQTLASGVAGEPGDMALAAGAIRNWAFAPWTVVTPLVGTAAIGAWLLAGRARLRATQPSIADAATFAVVVSLLNLAMMVVGFNLTFLYGVYFAMPVLAVALALPIPSGVVPPRVLASAMAVILIGMGTLRIVKYVRVAATWEGRDPRAVEQFVARHVPAGSDVFGPPHFFFYAVERSGSRYLLAGDEDWADWARVVNPGGVAARSRPGASSRFLLWPDDPDLSTWPSGFECAQGHAVARFVPAPNTLERLGPLGFTQGIPPAYPTTTLYALPFGCRP